MRIEYKGDRMNVGKITTRLIGALMLAGTVGAANANANTSDWQVIDDIGSFNFAHVVRGAMRLETVGVPTPPPSFLIVYAVSQGDGSWRLHADADASQPGVEALWLLPEKKMVGLAATGTAMTSAGDRQSVCNSRHTGDRLKVGYGLCNSTLVSEIRDLGVLLTPLRPVTGKIASYRADVGKIQAIIANVNLDTVAFNLGQARQQLEREQTRAAMESQVRFAQQLASWRAGLQIGSETDCGYVIETRGPMVQIAGSNRSVMWLPREKVFPRGTRTPAELIINCK